MAMHWIIFLLCVVGLSESVNVTKQVAIGELNSVWLQLVTCADKQRCDWQRNHTCTENSSPHTACNGIVWRQELKGCDQCSSGSWFASSGWSGCSGTGCTDTVQSKRYSCTAAIRQPNCVKIETKFCDPKKVCDGQWSNWFKAACPVTCDGGIRFRSRTCIKNGGGKADCAGDYTTLIDSNLEPCNTQSCTQQPVWGTWGQCDCSKTKDHQRRQCTSHCPGTLPIFQYRDCAQCSSTTTIGATTTTAASTTTTHTPTATTTTSLTSTSTIKRQEKATADGRNAVQKTDVSTSTTEKSSFNQLSNPDGAGSDRVIIIVTATVVVTFLVVIILVLVLRMRRKTKPLQIQVQQQAEPPGGENRRSLLLGPVTDGVYEEMTLGGSCPNFKRPLPATPSSLCHPPKPPRRNRPLSQVSTHSFPDLQRSLSANDAVDQPLSAGPSPTGSFRVHQIYSNPHSGKYLKPMN